MNDKLRLTSFNDFNLNFDLIKDNFKFKNQDKLIQNDNRSIVELLKLYLTIDNGISYHNGLIWVGLNRRGLKLDMNPNKILDKDVKTELTYNDLKECIDYSKHVINEVGINANLDDLKVSSYHNCFDIPIDYKKSKNVIKESALLSKTNDYQIVERAVKIYKDDKQITPSTYIEKIISSQNDKELICIYDKQEHLKLDFHLTRFEHRVEKIPPKKRLSFKNVSNDLFNEYRNQSKDFINSLVFSALENINSVPTEILNDKNLFLQYVRTLSNDLNDIYKYSFAYNNFEIPKVKSNNRSEYNQNNRMEKTNKDYKIADNEIVNFAKSIHNKFKESK